MFGSQKRAHSPDEGDTSLRHLPQQHQPNQFQHGAPYGAPYQYQYGHKRFRYNNHKPSIEEQITSLGQTGSGNKDIGELVKDIEAGVSIQEKVRINAIIAKICRCIVSFPSRVGTYATLIGLISAKHYEISSQVINALHGSYSVYLEAQKWSEALTIIHLLSSLVNCKVIRSSALLSQFEFMLESTIEDTAPQARSDYFVFTILSSLPYVASELAQEETNEAFEKLLSTIENYLSRRTKEHLNVIRVWQTSDSTIQMDYLDSLWVQMRNFKACGWSETFLHRPYNDKEYMDTLRSCIIPINSPTFQIPSHTSQCFYPSPRIVFRLFEDDVAEGHRAIPGSDKIERFCIESHIRNIIDEFATDPFDCARHLTRMNHSDHLPMKHILIETILGELFALPRPRQDEILYHTLSYNLSRIYHPENTDEAKNNYNVILNEAVKILFNNLETMNVTCITRFVDWFSFYLNCTEFIHPWQTWTDACSSEPTSSKVIFVQDILLKCVRFSFHKKMLCLVQNDLPSLMPVEPSVQPKAVFGDDPKAQEMTDIVKNLVINKAGGRTICETLNIIVPGVDLPPDFVLKEEKHKEQLLKIDIFTTVILAMASKSLTHLSTAVGKFQNVFRALTSVPNGHFQLLQTIDSCLEKHPQQQVILIDKLLKTELVQAGDVCNWIFSESMKSQHLKSSTWEILNNTISRFIQAVDKLINEKDDLLVDSKEAEDKAAALKLKLENKETQKGNTTPVPDGDEDENDNENGDVVMKKELEEVDDNNQTVNTTETRLEDQEQLRKEQAQKANEIVDEKIKSARVALREFILQVFRMFCKSLNDHIQLCEASKTSFLDSYFKWMTGRMQEVYYRNYNLTREMHTELRVIIDGVPSIGSSIIDLNQ